MGVAAGSAALDASKFDIEKSGDGTIHVG